ncbi:MAG: DUF983 domain-containing protein [Marinomonas sp.]
MSDNSDMNKGQPGFGQAALFGLCPRCGARSLFDGVLKFAKSCPQCSLDFSRFNVGDGPAAFVTLIVGALMVGLALWLDVAVSPPFWVHALIWVPLTAVAVVYGLRLGKAALLISEYSNNAAEAGAQDLEEEAE